MIVVRSIIIHAVVFERARNATRQRFPTRSLVDVLANGHDPDHVAGEFFRALTLNVQACASSGPLTDRPE